jgi:hypothetical protein
MHGPDVAEVQRLLGVEADGEFGPITAAAVAGWKRARRSPPTRVLTPTQHRRLVADVPLRAVRVLEGWAARGLREQPPGSDRVPELVTLAGKLAVAAPVGRMGYPWCAFAAFLAALTAGGRSAVAGLRRRDFNALYTPTVLAVAEAGGYGLRIIRPAEAWRGDLVLFDWNWHGGDPADHVARLVEAPSRGRVRTVDGNSGAAGLVAMRERLSGSVRAFARDS